MAQTIAKRKRSDDADEEPPAKRIAHESTAKSINVSVVSDTGEWAPLLATAPGISLPNSSSFKAYKKYPGNNGRLSSELLLHCAAHSALEYTAREEESSSMEKLMNHYIGVFDPETQELQLVPASKVIIRATPRSDPGNETAEEDENPSLKLLSGRSTLGLAFGTRKAQKAIRALTENAISPVRQSSKSSPHKPVLNLAATAVLEAMDISAPSELAQEEAKQAIEDAKPGPKPNIQAETPADVYPLEQLVGLDSLRVLTVRDWQNRVEAGEDILTNSRFVSGRVRAIAESGDVRKTKALKYLLLLVQWYHALKPGPGGVKKLPSSNELIAAMMGVSEDLREGIKQRFADGNRLTKWHTSHLQLHICALALQIDNLATDTHDLSQDLQLQSTEIRKLYTHLGCTLSAPTVAELSRWSLSKARAGSHKVARLNLPLKIPDVGMGTGTGWRRG